MIYNVHHVNNVKKILYKGILIIELPLILLSTNIKGLYCVLVCVMNQRVQTES